MDLRIVFDCTDKFSEAMKNLAEAAESAKSSVPEGISVHTEPAVEAAPTRKRAKKATTDAQEAEAGTAETAAGDAPQTEETTEQEAPSELTLVDLRPVMKKLWDAGKKAELDKSFKDHHATSFKDLPVTEYKGIMADWNKLITAYGL